MGGTFKPSEMPAAIGEIKAGTGIYAWKRCDSSGNFIDWVVGDSESDYPESGEGDDGYTYEKVKDEVILYVWNKYEKKTNTSTVTDTLTATYIGDNIVSLSTTGKISSSAITASDLNNLSIEGFSGQTLYLIFYSNLTWTLYFSDYSEWSSGTYTISGSTVTISSDTSVMDGCSGSKSISRTTSNTTTTELGEVTSEDRNAYPDSPSTKHTDGYYYEYVGERVV